MCYHEGMTSHKELSHTEVESSLRDVEKYIEHKYSVYAQLVYFAFDDTVTIHRIAARYHGRGNGTKALQHICDFADELDLNLDLIPRAVSEKDDERLIGWYTRHGFEYEDHAMVRLRTSQR